MQCEKDSTCLFEFGKGGVDPGCEGNLKKLEEKREQILP